MWSDAHHAYMLHNCLHLGYPFPLVNDEKPVAQPSENFFVRSLQLLARHPLFGDDSGLSQPLWI